MAPVKKKEKEIKGEEAPENTHGVINGEGKEPSHPTRILPGMKRQTPEQFIQELQIHQIELETQAEELRRVQHELEKSRYQYIDLYESAPVGYLSLNEKTIVTKANLTAATLLGVERSTLINHGFGLFIVSEDLWKWDQYVIAIMGSGEKQTITIMMRRGDGSTFPARLESTKITYPDGSSVIHITINDISDIIEVMEILKSKESMIRALMDSPVDSIVLIDRNGIIIDVNETLARRQDMTVEQMKGLNVYNLLRPDLGESRRKRIDEVGRTGLPDRFEDIRDGRFYDNSLHPVCNAHGNVTHIAIIARDITDIKNKEAQIRKSEEKLQNLYSRLNSAMDVGNLAWWEMECGTGKVCFNERKAGMLGYKPEQFSHYTDFTKLLHPDDYEPTMQAMRDHLTGIKKNYETDYRIRTCTGEYRWFHDTGGISEYDPSGNPSKVTGFVIDITERKHAENALRESEERYRVLINGVPDYVIVHRSGIILYANPAAIKAMGRRGADLVGSDMMNYLAPESLSIVRTMIARRSSGEVVPPYEIKVITEAGNKKVIEVHGSLVMYDGEPASLLVLSDITGRKRNEEIQEALLHDFRVKNEEMERFVYTVSHDLKSPIITIKGFLGYLEKDALAGDAGRLHEDIVRIHTATRKMEEFITSLLELSRIGRIVNPPVIMPLRTLVNDAVETLDTQIREGGVSMIIPDDLPELYGDPARLQQVMTNLIDNAVKFMGDEIAPRIEITAYHRGSEVVVCVTDNGIGIAPENIEKIFSIFTKLNPEIPGSGIGLALVRRIVEVHGGKCWVESAGLGSGSTFCFSLPDKKPEGHKFFNNLRQGP
jgi:PAS domain S-box-containing protein